MSEEYRYRYRWDFVTNKRPVVSRTGEEVEKISDIISCRAEIFVSNRQVVNCEAVAPNYWMQEGGKDKLKMKFPQFVRSIADKIIADAFLGTGEQKTEMGKELDDKLSGSSPTASASLSYDDVAKRFFGRSGVEGSLIKKIVGNQSLAGSFLEFNTNKELPTKPPKIQETDEKDDDEMLDGNAMKIISDAIKNSTKKCVIFTGAPGTGKTYCVEEYVKAQKSMEAFGRSEYFVQFHSSYDYTDFVEGLRPVQGKDGKMEFVRMDGIFKAFCRKVAALNMPNNTYYFVIDEINRADLGRVFGELMYCFEKRGEKHKIATQYANLPAYGKDANRGNEKKEKIVPIEDGFYITDENGKLVLITDDCFADGFYIPENVVIIGTMNDIDRSVETFDFALRRRFDWVEIEADTIMRTSLKSMLDKAEVPADIVTRIVEKIAPRIEEKDKKDEKDGLNGVIAKKSGLGKEFKIGPAYFKDLKALKDHDFNKDPQKTFDEAFDEAYKKVLTDIWEHNVEPILKEYVRGRQNDDKFIPACKDALFPKEDENQSKKENSTDTPGQQQPAASAAAGGGDQQ